ncbi:50S ribosomal protein L29 [Candidatus Woesearchaeota archaeon]|nr:50S ribosomal protein L29 [Candidatus Woesearchaeota archaeon]
MKFKELLQMSKTEQDEKLKELELELIKLNAQVATGTPPKNAGQLRRVKKDIARLMLLKSSDEKGLPRKRLAMPESGAKSQPGQSLVQKTSMKTKTNTSADTKPSTKPNQINKEPLKKHENKKK